MDDFREVFDSICNSQLQDLNEDQVLELTETVSILTTLTETSFFVGQLLDLHYKSDEPIYISPVFLEAFRQLRTLAISVADSIMEYTDENCECQCEECQLEDDDEED